MTSLPSSAGILYVLQKFLSYMPLAFSRLFLTMNCLTLVKNPGFTFIIIPAPKFRVYLSSSNFRYFRYIYIYLFLHLHGERVCLLDTVLHLFLVAGSISSGSLGMLSSSSSVILVHVLHLIQNQFGHLVYNLDPFFHPPQTYLDNLHFYSPE